VLRGIAARNTDVVLGSKVERMATIAEQQAGVVSYRQLKEPASLTDAEIRTLQRRAVIATTSARGVFRVAGAERSWRQDLWVALLAGPHGTVASHLSAAALWGLVAAPSKAQVTVPRTSSGRFGGAITHHATVPVADRRRRDGFETTGIARTIVDCAAVVDQKRLNALVDAAFGKGLSSYRSVTAAWKRAGRIRGGALLKSALAPYSGGAEPGSVKAAHVLRRIYDWGLPMPLCEHKIHDAHGGFIARVDFIWRPWWLILEYDGDEYHGPRRWGIDDRVQGEIEALGYRLERSDRFDLRPSSTRLFDLLSGILLQPPTGPWPRRLPPESRPAA
jgi:hypothetical protein